MDAIKSLVGLITFSIYIFNAEGTYFSVSTGCRVPKIPHAGIRGQHNFFTSYSLYSQYSIGASITVVCKDEYKIASQHKTNGDGITTKCTAGGWSPSLSGVSCSEKRKVYCYPTEYPGLVITPKKSFYQESARITYSCEHGYHLIGQGVATCLSNGLFSSTAACKVIHTSKSCTYPGAPSNGQIMPLKATYAVGAIVTFSCDTGYSLVGVSSQKCLSTRLFSDKVPSCIKPQPKCPPPGAPPNGYLITLSEIKGHYSAGEYVMYECKDGFTLHGSARSYCTRSGAFQPETPVCRRKDVVCDFPGNPTNGTTIPEKSTYAVGESVVFRCSSGFLISGVNSTTCSASGSFSGNIPTCIKPPTKCLFPGSPNQGSTVPEKTEYSIGDSISFSCEPNYELDGSDTATCLYSGIFSAEIPQCNAVIKCNNPQLPPGGVLKIISIVKDIYLVGDEIAFDCGSGYRLVGAKILTCTETGILDAEVPTCEEIPTCTLTGVILNGRIITNKDKGPQFFEGDTIQYRCDEYYELEGSDSSICTINDQGSLSFEPSAPTCGRRRCEDPKEIQNGRLVSDTSNYIRGVKVLYECDEGYKLVGASVSTCQGFGDKLIFQPQPPLCERKSCSGPSRSTYLRVTPLKSIYYVGDRLSFECLSGFVLVGQSEAICVDENLYSNEIPSCKNIRCARPNRLRNGQVEPLRADYGIGDAIRFSCRTGYRLVGNEESTCTLTSEVEATFTPAGPICERITCARPLVPDNGDVFPDRATYYLNDAVLFSCDTGYELEGEAETICVGQDQYSDKVPQCKVVTCRRPSAPDDGYLVESSSLFKYQDVITYKCNDGFLLEGASTRTCQATGQFSFREPICKEITCQIPSFIRDGDVSPRGVVSIPYKDSVRFSCDLGYNLVGSETATCQIDGTLSERTPRCEAITCNAPSSSSTYSFFPIKSKYAIGDGITYTCASGYKIVGGSVGECLRSGKFNVEQVRCDRITCVRPRPIVNGNIAPSQSTYEYGDSISYACDEGYNLVGQVSATCGEDGFFPQDIPTCEPFTCPSPGFLQFGTIFPQQLNYRVGESVKFSCRSGYVLDGAESSICQLGGRFSQGLPLCKRVSCKSPGSIKSGSIFPPKRQYFVGDRVSFSCDYGYKLEGSSFSVCTESGLFSQALPICSAITCRNPGSPAFGTISPDQATYNVGDDVTHKCNDGYRIRGVSIATCVDENVFSARIPLCEEIGCRFPGNPENGFTEPVRPTYSVGSLITFECIPGYVVDGLESTTCGVGGVFEDEIPICSRITCDNPGAPRFGEIYPDRSKYGLGQRASFRCMEGYELKGASFIRCEDNGEFSDSIPACNPVTCEFPGSPDNGKTQPQKDEYTVNDVITFECDDGYRLVGLESSRCSDSGRFSGFLPTCKLAYCDNPGAPSFGVISPFQPRYAVGDKVTYSCTKNYEISGVTSAVCLANGQFSKGQAVCKRVSCSFPGVPDNGFTSPVSPLYGIGDSVTYSCIRGYEVVGSTSATCLSSGQFSDAVPNCSEQSCRPPVKPVFGSFAPDLPKYMYNQKVTFSCDEGYQLTGSRTSMCGTNGRFSEESPTCERVSCGFPGNPVKGYTSPTRSFYEIGEEVQFDCEEGYTLVGTQTSKCTESGSFDESLPSCIKSACTFPGRPLFGYASPNKPIFAIDEEVMFTCRRGYTLVGKSKSTCGDDGHFDSEIPKCQRASCKFPGNPRNGDTSPTSAEFNFRDRITFECRDGYTLLGAESAVCLASGMFSEDLPKCTRVACANPGRPPFGSVLPNRKMYSVDEVINFKCDDEYTLKGTSSAICNEEGEFSEQTPICEKITCSFPGQPANGITEPKRAEYAINATVNFRCDDGYQISGVTTASCQRNGAFTAKVPICERVTCSSLGSLLNGEISPDFTKFSVLDTVYFTCASGYTLLGKSSSVCQADGTFSNALPKCQRNVCLKPSSPVNGNIFPDRTAYNVGQRVTFRCNDGYRLEGNSFAKCEASGSFGSKTPTCREITCPFPGAPLRGSVFPSRKNYSIDEAVEYSCDTGYVLVGDDISKCGSDGDFSSRVPTCKRKECTNPGRPEFGKISPDFISYAVGQRVQFTCSDGYKLVGSQTMVCNRDGAFAGRIPTCEEITCDYPGEPANGKTVPQADSYAVGDSVTYECSSGYVLKGFTSSSCTESGKFSTDLPTCRPLTCRFPGNPEDGTVSPSQVSYEVGDSVSYECREGFKLVGRKTRKCSSTGLFDGIAPLCSQQTCRNPGRLNNGFLTPNLPEYAVNQMITYTCDNGYRLKGLAWSTCLETGAFSATQPECERVPTCKNPGPPAFGTISSTRPFFNVKDTVIYDCNFGYALDGTTEAECLPTGLFTAPKPSCTRVVCSFPGQPIGGSTIPQRKSYFMGDTVRYVCNPGYELIGTVTAKCTGSGKFNGKVPTCARKSCLNPGAPKFSTMTPEGLSYTVGQVVTFECVSGYKLRGSRESTCGEDERFFPSFPTCERITCLNPGSPTYASINPDLPQYVFGTTITYVCIDGYETNDETESVCSRNGLFSNPPPVCTRKMCRRPRVPVSGFISPSLPSYSVGRIVRYNCLEGYRLVGEDTARCGDDGKFDNDPPTCELIIVSCRFPGNPVNGVTTPKKVSYEVAERITYQCNRGYTISGVTSSICTSQGNFTGRVPTCKVEVCANPGAPIFGSIFPDIPNYTVGETITYSCKTGYMIIGAKENVCDFNGRFRRLNPICQRNVCSNPGKPVNGAMFPDLVTYSIGQDIKFSCLRGYEIVGLEEISCRESGKFSGAFPTCKRIRTCSNPGLLNGGDVRPNKRSYRIGETVSFTCDIGYKIIGNDVATCQENERWSEPLPICKITTCKNPGELANGYFRPNILNYGEGQSIRYFCHEGYRINGHETAECEDGTFDRAQPRCEPITCAYPGSPTDGKTFPRRSSYTFNQTVEYRCDDDYELIGSNKARCIASGKFDNEPSLCRKITCLTPEKPKFGGFKPFKLRYGIGDFITYECSAGYQLRGDEESKCLSTGAFSSQAPLCIRRQCKYLVELNNGNIFPKQQLYDIGDTIKYRCDDGYRKFGADSATCQNDGTFSADTPNCRIIICKYPGVSENGKTAPVKRQYRLGDVVRYQCSDGFHLVGKDSATCQTTGEFSAPPPKCKAILCDYPGQPADGATVPRKTSYKGGDIVEFSCKNKCYDIRGSRTAVCTSSGAFSQDVPTCELKQCTGHPEVPKYGMLKPMLQNYTCGQAITYVCKAGLRRVGTLETQCLPNGKFKGTSPTCQVVKCGLPPSISNGSVSSKKKQYIAGDVVSYRCRVKYRMIGDPHLRCGKFGSYVGRPPTCKAVTCSEPQPPRNGRILSAPSQGISPGDAVEFECDENYLLIGESYSICQINGAWQQEFPVCQEQGCEHRCTLPKIAGLPCQCDKMCQERGDCCNDYEDKCSRGSCKGRCGESKTTENECSCETLCSTRYGKECCYDYGYQCGNHPKHRNNSTSSFQAHMGLLSYFT